MTPAAQGAGRGAAEMRVLVCSSQQTLSKTERGYMRRYMYSTSTMHTYMYMYVSLKAGHPVSCSLVACLFVSLDGGFLGFFLLLSFYLIVCYTHIIFPCDMRVEICFAWLLSAL